MLFSMIYKFILLVSSSNFSQIEYREHSSVKELEFYHSSSNIVARSARMASPSQCVPFSWCLWSIISFVLTSVSSSKTSPGFANLPRTRGLPSAMVFLQAYCSKDQCRLINAQFLNIGLNTCINSTEYTLTLTLLLYALRFFFFRYLRILSFLSSAVYRTTFFVSEFLVDAVWSYSTS